MKMPNDAHRDLLRFPTDGLTAVCWGLIVPTSPAGPHPHL